MQIPSALSYFQQDDWKQNQYKSAVNTAATSDASIQKSQQKQSKVEETYKPFQSEFQEAVTKWVDEKLSGLTEEEREEIQKKIQEYLEKYPLDTDEQIKAFQAFVKSLYEAYGFKGHDYALDMLDTEVLSTEVSAQTAISPSTSAPASSSASKTESKVMTESDGTQVMVITTSNGFQYKIKLSEGGGDLYQKSEDDASGQQQSQNFAMKHSIAQYESNFLFAT